MGHLTKQKVSVAERVTYKRKETYTNFFVLFLYIHFTTRIFLIYISFYVIEVTTSVDYIAGTQRHLTNERDEDVI